MNLKTVLLLTNSEDSTSDFLCNRLTNAGLRFARYNTDVDCPKTEFLYEDCVAGMAWEGHTLYSDQVSSIILRRPKALQLRADLDGASEEHTIAEWSEAIEGFLAHIDENVWINHPAYNCMASHKIEQLTRAKKYGLNIPQTIVTNSSKIAKDFFYKQLDGVIVKPLASGFVERDENDTIIYTSDFSEEHMAFLEEIRECPVMFQAKVRKNLDVRVTVLDETIIAVALVAEELDGVQRLDIRRNNMSDVNYFTVEIPPTVSDAILFLLKSYKLRFAALDFGITASGDWLFFEINPNGQWAWLDIYADAGISKVFVEKLGETQLV